MTTCAMVSGLTVSARCTTDQTAPRPTRGGPSAVRGMAAPAAGAARKQGVQGFLAVLLKSLSAWAA